MKPRLLDLLACPHCGGGFTAHGLREAGGEIESGRLRCACGWYPVAHFIPRLLPESRQPLSSAAEGAPPPPAAVIARTRESFGYQWTAFGKMSDTFEANFLNYIAPIEPSFFPGRLGLDAGCGFGRHLYHAARYGAEMVGLDASAAIEVARRNANGERAHFVQGDILRPPFRPGVFDFVYSLGVLHHLPDPEAGFQSLNRLRRQDGALWLWVYSKKRRVTNLLLETTRQITKRLPFPLLHGLSYAAAAVEYGLFIRTGRRLLRSRLGRWVPPRVALYAGYPFQVSVADWFDWLSAPVRYYYDTADLVQWAERAGWKRYRIEPTGAYGFRLQLPRDGESPCAA